MCSNPNLKPEKARNLEVGLQYAQVMASAVLAAIPLVVVFLFFQRQIIRGFATTGFGGQ